MPPPKKMSFKEIWSKYRWLQEDIAKARVEHEGEC